MALYMYVAIYVRRVLGGEREGGSGRGREGEREEGERKKERERVKLWHP